MSDRSNPFRSDDKIRVDGGPSLTLDEIFEILASERRRVILYELRGEEHVELMELAERVADRAVEMSGEETDGAPDEALIDRIAVELHHQDLPKLHQARLIEFDDRQGDIAHADYFDLVEKYLDVAESDEQF